MKAILIDDDHFSLKVLAHQLKQLGYPDAVTYDNARAALVDLETHAGACDLIVCDLQMPEMDGVEFLRHLMRIGYAGSLILVTGEDERVLSAARQLAEGKKLKVQGALRKPVSLQKLQQALEQSWQRMPSANCAATFYKPDELRRAISQGELVNYYQPQVDATTGALVGFEALVRWRHPRDGLVSPDRFIPLAEEHNLIGALTQQVMADALRQSAIWHGAGLSLRVAVNVSMDNLDVLDFPAFVAHTAEAAGAPLSALVLEVTESQAMRNPLVAIDILTRLRLKRVSLSIDDFGTGHSSLAQLRDIPFDELKIDRSFVHGASENASCKAIFEASVGIAKKLGLKTVAEGVADRDDWDWVQAAGCHVAQGYFIGHPIPAADIDGWIVDWKRRRPEFTRPRPSRAE